MQMCINTVIYIFSPIICVSVNNINVNYGENVTNVTDRIYTHTFFKMFYLKRNIKLNKFVNNLQGCIVN